MPIAEKAYARFRNLKEHFSRVYKQIHPCYDNNNRGYEDVSLEELEELRKQIQEALAEIKTEQTALTTITNIENKGIERIIANLQLIVNFLKTYEEKYRNVFILLGTFAGKAELFIRQEAMSTVLKSADSDGLEELEEFRTKLRSLDKEIMKPLGLSEEYNNRIKYFLEN